MGVLLGLNMISYLAGYVLPLPCAVMAWVGWFRIRKVPPRKAWRRLDSLISLAVLTAARVLWLFYVIRLGQGADLFEMTATNVATLGTALLIVPSPFAEKKIRLWLVLGAISLVFFFASSTGEIAI
jgi:hypothetical protein